MFITAKTLGDGQKTVILNADYIKSIETGGIVHMVDTVKKYKTGADAIQRLLAEMFTTDDSLGVGTQHFRPHESQHARPPYPSPTPRVH